MTVRMILVAGALLASTSAWAQAPGTEQTTEDLVCQLSEKCADESATPAEEAVEAPAAPSGARVSATRGFKIARKVPEGSSPAAPAARAGGSSGQQGARVATERAKKSVAGSPGKARPQGQAMVRPMPMGRADLRVSFVSGSAELTEAGQREAQKFASALASPLLQGMRFTIEGHTDSIGTRESNIDLSRRRAQAVVDYLVGKGADRSRFDVVGYGYDRPIEGTSASNAVNRRVEVVKIK